MGKRTTAKPKRFATSFVKPESTRSLFEPRPFARTSKTTLSPPEGSEEPDLLDIYLEKRQMASSFGDFPILSEPSSAPNPMLPKRALGLGGVDTGALQMRRADQAVSFSSPPVTVIGRQKRTGHTEVREAKKLVIQRRLIIGGQPFETVEQIANLLAHDEDIGWDERWGPIVLTLLQMDEALDSPKQLEMFLESQQGQFDDSTTEAVFVATVVRKAESFLSELLDLLMTVPADSVREIVEPLVEEFFSAPETQEVPDSGDMARYITALLSGLRNIRIDIKDTIAGGVANAETRKASDFPGFAQPDFPGSPAGIDLARRSSSGQLIPDMRTTEENYHKMLNQRIFTLIHELTHSILGTADKTNSLKAGIDKAHLLKGPGTLKMSTTKPNYAINADSWVIVLAKMRARLRRKHSELLH